MATQYMNLDMTQLNNTLVVIKGYKLPTEEVWVTADDMYNVYDRITLSIDGGDNAEMIITGIEDEGLTVEVIN